MVKKGNGRQAMNERVFNMRLACRYTGSENDMVDLEVELLEDGTWKVFNLDTETAGFLVLVYSVFTCQHMHLRLGCAEHNLLLEAATGSIHLVANEDWYLAQIHVDFNCQPRSGSPTSEHISSITRRMMNCPVSRNLKSDVDCKTSFRFEKT